MEEQGMDHKQLAKKAGLAEATVWYILTDKRQPMWRTINALVGALGYEMNFKKISG